MQTIPLIFTVAGTIIILGFLGEWIFTKTKIPDPIWLMIFGIILGRFFHVSDSPSFLAIGALFTTFALIYLLFEGVLNTNLKDLTAGFTRGASLTIFGFIFSVSIVTAAMMLFKWGFLESLLLGIVLSDVAQAVIIPLMKKVKINPQASLSLTFESAFTDVLGIVGAVAVINIIILESFSIQQVIGKIAYSFALAIFIGILAGLFWVKIHQLMDKFSKSYITTIAALLLLYGLVEYLGANGALACLAFGIVVGNSKSIFEFITKKSQTGMESSEKFFYSEISFFVKTFFFVYIGLVINLKEPLLIVLGLFLTILIFLVRPLAVSITQRGAKYDEKSMVYLQVMIPKGLSAAVLAMLPLQYGIANAQQFSTIVLSVIAFSIFLCIIFVFFIEKGKFKGLGPMLNLRKFSHKGEEQKELTEKKSNKSSRA